MSDEPIVQFDQLLTPPTPREVKAKYYELLSDLGAPTTSWKAGGIVRLVIATFSILVSLVLKVASDLARSVFLQTSSGVWLTMVAWFRYHVRRLDATFATANVTLTNAQGGEFPRPAYSVIVRNAAGKTYTNTTAFTLAPNGTVTVPFAATVAGSASSSGVGTIEIVTTMSGVTASNVTAFVGSDAETDQALVVRCLAKPQSLSPNGPRGAFYWFAFNAARQADGSRIGVNRVLVSPSSLTGQLTVTVATPSGGVSGTQTNYATDLGAIRRAIVENCLPACVTLAVVSADTNNIPVQFWAYFADREVDAATQRAVVQGPLAAWMGSTDMPIGGVTIPLVASHIVPRDTMRDIISQAFVDAGYPRPTLVRIISPAADWIVGDNQTPVLSALTAAA